MAARFGYSTSLETTVVFALLVVFVGAADFFGDWACEYFSRSALIVVLRNDTGMRFTRLSIRDLRSCACSAYWARSFRARSVTRHGQLPSTIKGYGYVDSQQPREQDILSN